MASGAAASFRISRVKLGRLTLAVARGSRIDSVVSFAAVVVVYVVFPGGVVAVGVNVSPGECLVVVPEGGGLGLGAPLVNAFLIARSKRLLAVVYV